MALSYGYNDKKIVCVVDSDTATKKWVSDKYVSKSVMITAEWVWFYLNTGSTYRYPHKYSGWPAPVRTDEITGFTNLELRRITFDNELNKTQILACTLIVTLRYNTANANYEHEIFNLPLTNKTVLEIRCDTNTTTCTLPLKEEYWLRGIIPSNRTVFAFSVKIKLTGVPAGRDPELTCTFRLNESGQS